jgi:16S rRNA (guanine527-N7)-methyltransferase
MRAAEPVPPLPAEDFSRLLQAAAGGFPPAAALSPAARETIAVYLSELDRWRRRVNLTGRLSAEDLAIHALESIVPISLIPEDARVVDIGSGGGFPAIPIASARPDIAMTMVEPRAKKAAFLRHAARTLRLAKARVLETGIEGLSEGPFSVATSRALGEIAGRLGRATFLEPGGLLLAWTSDSVSLAERLSGQFRLEQVLKMPAAERRAVAAFRRD